MKSEKTRAGKAPRRPADQADEADEFKVQDRRHWVERDEADENDDGADEAAPAPPPLVDAYRGRAEEAEQRLQDYIEAFKTFKTEQEQVRVRLERDNDRRVALKFGGLVSDLLESWDDLDLALGHADPEADGGALIEGLQLARKRFLSTLARNGVESLTPDGQPFDPNVAEAVRMDPVDTAERNGIVTETLRPGFRLGDHVIRPARVAVGRHVEPGA